MERSILEFHFKIDRLIYIIAYTFLSLYEKIENSKEFIRSRISNYRQCRGQNKTDNRTNNHLLNIAQKTKERARRTSLKTMSEHKSSGRVIFSFSQTRIYLRLSAKRGVANLLKHQSLDTSRFRCQHVLVFNINVCIPSGEDSKISKKQRMQILLYFGLT